MPKISGKILQKVNPNTYQYISVKIYIFKGKVTVFEKPNIHHPQLYYSILNGFDPKVGFSTINLENGVYTVVMEINGQMYLNNYSKEICNVSEGYEKVEPTWSYIVLHNNDINLTGFLYDDRDPLIYVKDYFLL